MIKSGPMGAYLPPKLLWFIKFFATLTPLPMAKVASDLFLEDKRDSHPVLFLGLLATIFSMLSLFFPSVGPVRSSLLLALFAFLFYLAISTARDDLVLKRRLFRPILLGTSSCLGIFIATSQFFQLPLLHYTSIFFVTTFLINNLAFAFFMLRPMPGVWASPKEQVRDIKPISSPRNPALAQALNEAMEGGIWRQEHLSIKELAKHIGGREHHLRALINKDLGFRNFSSFINSYRIDAAQKELIERSDKSILEIAYDCGFASLAPFNKAFRAHTDLTPSQYRQSATPITAT